jgi:hypothetical protein
MSDGNRVLFFFPKRPNQAVTRLVSFQVFVVCVLVLIFGEDNHAVAGRVGSWCVPRSDVAVVQRHTSYIVAVAT